MMHLLLFLIFLVAQLPSFSVWHREEPSTPQSVWVEQDTVDESRPLTERELTLKRCAEAGRSPQECNPQGPATPPEDYVDEDTDRFIRYSEDEDGNIIYYNNPIYDNAAGPEEYESFDPYTYDGW